MRDTRRNIYSHQELNRLFQPKSIAVFGASPNEASFGARTLANLRDFPGRIYRINPRYERIGDHPCYPSVTVLPEHPDCVVLTIPRESVEEAVLDCVKGGAGGVIVYASGYVETGLPERAQEQARLTNIAHHTGLKIVGPNTIGFVNFAGQAVVSFASTDISIEKLTRPGIGIVSQSGAIGFALAQAGMCGMSFSHVLTFGNGCDVNIADQIAYLAGDPTCGAIACLFEGMSDPLQLLEAGELARKADKPVIICKLGKGTEAAAAALSHTGSLVGSAAAYMALFERAGFIVVAGVDRLLETASFFNKVPQGPLSRGVAAVGGSGGALIAAADAAEANNLLMPQPPEDMKARMRPHVPDFGALRNPCDLTAMGARNAMTLANTVEAMLIGDTYGAMVLPQAGLSKASVERRNHVAEVGRRLGKPICLAQIGGWTLGPGTVEAEQNPYFQWFNSVDSCFAALRAWHHRDNCRRQDMGSSRTAASARLSPIQARNEAGGLIKAAAHTTLTEREAKAVLALYGVPVVRESLVKSADEAVSAAACLGMPVVLKVESPDLPHKTEAGVISLNLRSAKEIRSAYETLMVNAAKVIPKPRISGMLVQPMIAAGTEIMIGGKIDPLFGPLMVAGIGGVMVEAIKDTVVEILPLDCSTARAMLGRLRSQSILSGFRGAPPVDLDRLADIVVRVAEFMHDHQDIVVEVDVNPLVCIGSRILAVDALIIRKN